jgi:hypothetical protein
VGNSKHAIFGGDFVAQLALTSSKRKETPAIAKSHDTKTLNASKTIHSKETDKKKPEESNMSPF